MNWEKANKREQVLKKGGERISIGRKVKSKKKSTSRSKKNGKKGKNAQSGAIPGCRAPGGQHSFGPWIEYGFPHFGRVRICLVCNLKDARKSGNRLSANAVPTRRELEHKLARLEGRPVDQDPQVKLIVSRRTIVAPEPARREVSRQVPPMPITFDYSIHQIHRVGEDSRWRCCCTWQGVGTGTRAEARGLHKDDWMACDGDARRHSDITAVTYLLDQYDQQQSESETAE